MLRDARIVQVAQAATTATESLFPGLRPPDPANTEQGNRICWVIGVLLEFAWEVRARDGLFIAELNLHTLGDNTDCVMRRTAAMPGRVFAILRDFRETLLGQAALLRRLDDHPPQFPLPYGLDGSTTAAAGYLRSAFPGFDVVEYPKDDLVFVDVGLFRPAVWNVTTPEDNLVTRKNDDGVMVPAKRVATLNTIHRTCGILTRWGHFLPRRYSTGTLDGGVFERWVERVREDLQKDTLRGILQACGV